MNSTTESAIPLLPPSPVRRAPLRYFAGFVWMVFFWPTAALALLVLNVATAWSSDKKRRQSRGQRAIAWLLGTFINGLEFLGIFHVSDEDVRRHAGLEGPLIIASNHPALWDALLVIRGIGPVSCIMKADLLANPLIRSGALFAGFLPNAPRLKMVRKAVACLAGGGRLLLFPEGTRTREKNGAVNPFRPGLALMAKQSGAPVLPVFISTNSRYLQKGWPLWRMPTLPITISLTAGEIVTLEPGERVRDFSQRLEDVFRKRLG